MEKNEINEKLLDYYKKLNLMVVIRNCISLICFTILAIVFKKWWIVFGAILFYCSVSKEKEE